jgi:predicted alpha-1,2-mannosidase
MSRTRPILLVLTASLLVCHTAIAQQGLTRYVDPFIGTGGHGHTYPGPALPFGMIQAGPDTRLEGWDGCSGYHYSDDTLYGFSHTHLSGTGCSDYGDVLLMPVPKAMSPVDYAWRSSFDHDTETAHPGYYSVMIENSGIFAEITTTARTAFHRYTYPEKSYQGLIIDLKHRDKVLDSYLKIINDTTIVGYRRSQAWAADQQLYFAAVFSKPIKAMLVSQGGKTGKNCKSAKGIDLIALLSFDEGKDQQLLVKLAISAVSQEGALANLRAEIPGQDFGSVALQADQIWEKELSKITASTDNEENLKIFYTALYHAMLCPNLYQDVDGKYRGRDLKVHHANDFDYYSVFSLWDTYRAAHPLYTIIDRKRSNDFINTFIAQYREGNRLPVWELSANETECMIGYHAVSVIADAYMKDIRSYDTEVAFEAMVHSAGFNHYGLKYYKLRGYISSEDFPESVSRTLEYAYDDWCIAQMAREMKKGDAYYTYIQRAQYWKNVFDPSTGFLRARANGGWFSPFAAEEVNNNYTEANAWQYSFYVPQDIGGLMKYHGGPEKFSARMDEMFSAESSTSGREQADITGLIGQYAHGNEPSHHMAYLYAYTGEPWKTQALVHRICSELYTTANDGLCGNEDCGQMSAWYVFSAMGFYPVTPASNQYIIGTPRFERVDINLENGNIFTLRCEDLSDENYYIQSAELNGVPLDRPWIHHHEIQNGGELLLRMGPAPNKEWGSGKSDRPVSVIEDHLIVPVPFVITGEKVFQDSTIVTLGNAEQVLNYYSINGSNNKEMKDRLIIDTTSIFQAHSLNVDSRMTSKDLTSFFSEISDGYAITIKNAYAPQYSAGGARALIDHIEGGEDFRTGAWQGYEGVDLEANVDMGIAKNISNISIRFIQDQGAWIFMPLKVDFYYSQDGKDYIFAGKSPNTVDETTSGSVVSTFKIKLKPTSARYIKIVAQNRGVCPEWHPGAGNRCWIFADEIHID